MNLIHSEPEPDRAAAEYHDCLRQTRERLNRMQALYREKYGRENSWIQRALLELSLVEDL